ncbi:MAG TPA: TIR domain-containing protein [Candidatus Binatus sp.]|jgi:hypothetical protein|nr:TIR domain-containing protein [Candidatus Binatus sp.]
MDIFISWSGPRSRAVAEALKDYLPIIVNAFNPWLSCADIDKGARWASELAAALATAKAGIVCLTPNNLTAPYILFEAGALSKSVEKTYVCTLLIGMEPSDVSGPLAQFQATKPTRAEILQLLKTLNRALGDSALKEPQLETSFNLCWPKLTERLDELPEDGPTTRPEREQREMLEELVDLARATSSEITEVNRRLIVEHEKSLATEAQLRDLTETLVPAAAMSPAMWEAAGRRIINDSGSSGTIQPQPLRGTSRGISRNSLRDVFYGGPPPDEPDKE